MRTPLRALMAGGMLGAVGATVAGGYFFGWSAAGAVSLLALVVGSFGYLIGRASTQRREEADRSRQFDITWRAIGEAVLSCDLAGRLVRMNPAAEALLLRWNVEETGQPVSRLFELRSPGPDAHAREPVTDILVGRSAGVRERLVLRRRDGSDRIVLLVATPMREEDGSLQGVVVVMRDVTAEHHLEEQVRRTQRAQSLAQLASGVAHDYNNLLQVMRMNLEFLADRITHDPQASEYVGEIDRSASRAAELTNQLLALGGRRPLLKQLIEAGDLVSNFLHVIRRLMGPQIEVQWSQPTRELWLSGDMGELEQVLLNLCSNARDAMPVGGKLLLGATRAELSVEQAQRWPWARAGRYVVISVQDTGIGMDDATRARVFEPFYTTKPLEQGIGLGLSVVLGLIQQHGGFINVASRLGHGATFELYFPEQPAPATKPVAAAVPTEQPASILEKCILVVEDDPAVRLVSTAVLVRHGYRVMEAGDGQEACDVVRTRGSEIALIVMDVVMPRMGGVDAARQIVQLRPELPIILCTGDHAADTRTLIGGTDRWHLLAKPFGSDELLRAVANAAKSAAAPPS